MSATSFIFFGLMLIPFIVFIVWLIKQDKKRNYLGLAVLLAAIIVAVIVAIYVDAKYMKM
ncbi:MULTISPECIES: hypothetical protein [unclassified Pedobacter]|jgi:uncharacterized membrane protein YqjE|uniref:hypothetical protein n=1 Tax=unclassified Pedobacter TaxID=2628915 RepID=UPI000F5B0CC0|nr:hypothetical protein [Pedobacter sp. KBW06]RQO64596.1 hypothetical protein DBR43_32975 [Pedobacter sp. KBW06]